MAKGVRVEVDEETVEVDEGDEMVGKRIYIRMEDALFVCRKSDDFGKSHCGQTEPCFERQPRHPRSSILPGFRNYSQLSNQ